MAGVLGLLTGWALLMPAVLMLYVRLGLPYFGWMAFFLGIAASFPVLVLTTLAGFAVIFFSVKRLSQPVD